MCFFFFSNHITNNSLVLSSFMFTQARDEVVDLYTDLSDGKRLMKLLEIISGEHIGRPNKGVLRVQKVENVNRCLQFLLTKVVPVHWD